ncbi:MAG: hypothetical protein MSG64_19740 [Pyrinomonadaceae bacterium MAG19_C2-C3]|nr:hypothetical protein [Pyrinomonadaceae bacterium MAG19_C2-C3]
MANTLTTNAQTESGRRKRPRFFITLYVQLLRRIAKQDRRICELERRNQKLARFNNYYRAELNRFCESERY